MDTRNAVLLEFCGDENRLKNILLKKKLCCEFLNLYEVYLISLMEMAYWEIFTRRILLILTYLVWINSKTHHISLKLFISIYGFQLFYNLMNFNLLKKEPAVFRKLIRTIFCWHFKNLGFTKNLG